MNPVGRPPIKIGDTRGSQTVIGLSGDGTQKHPRYLVRCTCGNVRHLSAGSFGTLTCRKCRKWGRPLVHADAGVTRTKLYGVWRNMNRRCRPIAKDPRNKRYGMRGIRVCAEWAKDFSAFSAWASAKGYAEGLSLDRIDSDKDYSPSNCEWVTRSENSKRMRAGYELVKRSKDRWPLSVYLPIEALFGAV